MAQKNIEKGSDEWQFFQDFFALRKKYHDSDGEPEQWFEELVHEGEKVIKKYENTDIALFARGLVLEHFADIERRERLKHGKFR